MRPPLMAAPNARGLFRGSRLPYRPSFLFSLRCPLREFLEHDPELVELFGVEIVISPHLADDEAIGIAQRNLLEVLLMVEAGKHVATVGVVVADRSPDLAAQGDHLAADVLAVTD
jgi:hypothetical protein